MYYKLLITSTSRNCLKDEPSIFDERAYTAIALSEVKEKLIELYGVIPNSKNKIYRDTETNETQEVGFLHSFWNYDCSHNNKKWFQTDWIELTEVTEKPVLIHKLLK